MIALALAVLLIVTSGLNPISAQLTKAGTAPRAPRADFSGEGYGDLAIGVSGENLTIESSDEADAGAVSVLYGDSNGLSTTFNQFWYQSLSAILGESEADDFFGQALAVGDFDGDGFMDLAVGIPEEDYATIEDCGTVVILYGSGSGLSGSGTYVWYQGANGLADSIEANDQFGAALAAGDFDGDGYDDLAIGAPKEDLENGPTITNAGVVHVLYGSSDGLKNTDSDYWHQNSTDLEGNAGNDDLFGDALAAGDLNGDGRDDLAIGAPGDDVLGTNGAGVVNVLYGTPDGLSVTGDQMWTQGTTDVEDTHEAGDWFGDSLAMGDLNGDGYDDLAIGVPYEDLENGTTISDAGAVNVLYGTQGGLGVTGDQVWFQADIATLSESLDSFGWALAIGDFDRDGYDDLAVGVPYEDYPATLDTGALNVLYGTASGLSAIVHPAQIIYQGIGATDSSEEDDHFGWALAAGDFDDDGFVDLAVGAPYEDVENGATVVDAGAVNVLYGSSTGLSGAGDGDFFYQGDSGVLDSAETDDHFGIALAAFTPRRHWVFLPLVVRNH
jgi:hypothetical protein